LKLTSTEFQKKSNYDVSPHPERLEYCEIHVNILCLSTYPAENPTHGGQHRLSNIIAELQARGHKVCSAGVLGSPTYPPSPYFVVGPDPAAMGKVYSHYGLMEDWVIGEIFATDEAFFSDLADKIPMSPDIIVVEQPWLFQFAERFNIERLGKRARLLYGSQNIEHQLKEAILKRYYSDKYVNAAREKVLQCELHAIMQAERIFCVSQNDVDWTREYSIQEPVLAANGVIDRRASMMDIAAANKITHGRKFALYCASAHPPNMEGFFDIFGGGAGCIPPEARIVIAGGAGQSIATDPRLSRTGSLERQLVDAGQVTEEVLRGLLATAHLMVLPITSGGGTNLKTAEALWSGHHIVATSKAMRGFEVFLDSPGVHITDDRVAFLNAIREVFLQPNLQIDIAEREARSIILWESTLAEMMCTIDEMKIAE
jgi:Glycosyl transferases group 1